MSQRGICTMCKQMVSTAYPHSCFDFDAVERLRDAERAVIDAALAYCHEGELTQFKALMGSVRRLREVTP